MGVNISGITVRHQTTLKEQSGIVVAVDGYNIIYQFLSSIRQPDGTPLMNREGHVTSHISGIFYRTINLIESGIQPVYVLDGPPSPLKNRTLQERKLVKEKARVELEVAREAGDIEKMKSYSSRLVFITEEIIKDVTNLLSYMGLPVVQAPSEGEAQASYMNRNNFVSGVVSQDYDCLLFGAKRVFRNFAIYGRRKFPGRSVYMSISPEYVDLEETLNKNQVTLEQLIDIGILVGTDFNAGIKGVGAKTALKLIHKHGDIREVLKEKGMEIEGLEEVRNLFLNPPVTTNFETKFSRPQRQKLEEFLCEINDFSLQRVSPYIDTLEESFKSGSQSNLDTFFS